jgi:threonine synthase
MYFLDNFGPEFDVKPKSELKSAPVFLKPERLKKIPEPGKPLEGEDMEKFVQEISAEIAGILELEKK